VHAVQEFALYFNQSPDRLGREHIRQYQAHLFAGRKLDAIGVTQPLCALRFFFLKTLQRRWRAEDMPCLNGPCAYPRYPPGKKWNGSSHVPAVRCIEFGDYTHRVAISKHRLVSFGSLCCRVAWSASGTSDSWPPHDFRTSGPIRLPTTRIDSKRIAVSCQSDRLPSSRRIETTAATIG
jgi:hypothetical protein